MKKVFVIEGLDCAHCAEGIAEAVRGIEGVSSAEINFALKKLTVYYDNAEDSERILEETIKLAEIIQDGIRVTEAEPVSGGHTHEHEHKDSGKVTVIRLMLSAALFAVALIFNFTKPAELALFAVSYLLSGAGVIYKAVRNILRGRIFDENFLMLIASIGAFAIGEYPEGVAVMLFYMTGETLQDYAVERSRRSITALIDIRPDYANLLTPGGERRIRPEEAAIGDFIIIKPGERVPLDVRVTEGASSVDTSAITGESAPREAVPGTEVLSGSVNINGLIKAQVLRGYKDSAVSRILELVENAGGKKARAENFITKFAKHYTPVVVGIAALLAVIPTLFIPGAVFTDWLHRGLVFLVVSCPCALVISIPLSFFGGIGAASRKGILVKGGNFLEALNYVDTVAYDKTGTLTYGKFKVSGLQPAGITPEELLEAAAYAESYSTHPLALSVLAEYGKTPDKSKNSDYQEIPGYGVKVVYNGKKIAAGNLKLMEKEGVKISGNISEGTAVYVALNGKYAGFIEIADQLKPDAVSAVEKLRALGIKRQIMLSGDSSAIAAKIAAELKLDKAYAELLPGQKVDRLEEIMKGARGKTAYLGDGVNDAPVLTRADIGIAMGGVGRDAAVEAADIVFMTDEPSKLVTAIEIARKTRNIVVQNIIFALGVKFAVLILAALGLANMWAAVFADVGVAMLAVLNAVRILRLKE